MIRFSVTAPCNKTVVQAFTSASTGTKFRHPERTGRTFLQTITKNLLPCTME